MHPSMHPSVVDYFYLPVCRTSAFGSHYLQRELFQSMLDEMMDNAGTIDSFPILLNSFDEFARNREDNMLDPYRELVYKAFSKDTVQEIVSS